MLSALGSEKSLRDKFNDNGKSDYSFWIAGFGRDTNHLIDESQEAEKYLLQFKEALEGSKDFQEFLRLNIDLGILHVERGDPEKGKERLEEMMAIVKEKELDKTFTYPPYIMWGLSSLVDACARVGDRAGVETWTRKAAEMAGTHKSDQVAGFEAVIQGRALVSEKKFAESRAQYEKAVRLLRKGIFVQAFAGCLRELGEVYLGSGDEAGAKKAFAEASEVYRKMGANAYLEKVTAAAASLN
jgi:tetratricopeptide (TPR) repeat protein